MTENLSDSDVSRDLFSCKTSCLEVALVLVQWFSDDTALGCLPQDFIGLSDMVA